jgi:hypothetical protein
VSKHGELPFTTDIIERAQHVTLQFALIKPLGLTTVGLLSLITGVKSIIHKAPTSLACSSRWAQFSSLVKKNSHQNQITNV